MKKAFVITITSFVFFSCHRTKQPDFNTYPQAYSVSSIDSIVDIINSKTAEQFSKANSIFTQFILSDSTEKLENLSFDNSSLKLIIHLQRCGKDCYFMIRYYFKDGQLIKASFATAEAFKSLGQGDYYYSKGKLLLNSTIDDTLPSPQTVSDRAKNYLKKN